MSGPLRVRLSASAGSGHEPREAEVEDLGPAIRGHHDVLRLQVAVHDPLLVGRGQRLRHLGPEGQSRSGGSRPFLRRARRLAPSTSSMTM